MKKLKFNITLLALVAVCFTALRCTKLDSKVYSQIVNENCWQTPEQIAAGKSPAYAALQGLGGNSGVYWENEISSDEMITPTRGGDWGDGGMWTNMWNHFEKPGGGKTPQPPSLKMQPAGNTRMPKPLVVRYG